MDTLNQNVSDMQRSHDIETIVYTCKPTKEIGRYINELIQAVEAFNEKKIIALVEGGVSINVANSDGNTALHVAAKNVIEEKINDQEMPIMDRIDDTAAMDMLFFLPKQGADINAQDSNGNTVLMQLVNQLPSDSDEITKNFVLQYKPRLDITNKKGCTVFDIAAKSEHIRAFLFVHHDITNGAETVQNYDTAISSMNSDLIAEEVESRIDRLNKELNEIGLSLQYLETNQCSDIAFNDVLEQLTYKRKEISNSITQIYKFTEKYIPNHSKIIPGINDITKLSKKIKNRLEKPRDERKTLNEKEVPCGKPHTQGDCLTAKDNTISAVTAQNHGAMAAQDHSIAIATRGNVKERLANLQSKRDELERCLKSLEERLKTLEYCDNEAEMYVINPAGSELLNQVMSIMGAAVDGEKEPLGFLHDTAKFLGELASLVKELHGLAQSCQNHRDLRVIRQFKNLNKTISKVNSDTETFLEQLNKKCGQEKTPEEILNKIKETTKRIDTKIKEAAKCIDTMKKEQRKERRRR